MVVVLISLHGWSSAWYSLPTLTDVLAIRIRALREENGLTMRAAAGRAGMTHTYWAKLESGDGEPALAAVLRIQWAFGLPSIESLLGDVEFPSWILKAHP